MVSNLLNIETYTKDKERREVSCREDRPSLYDEETKEGECSYPGTSIVPYLAKSVDEGSTDMSIVGVKNWLDGIELLGASPYQDEFSGEEVPGDNISGKDCCLSKCEGTGLPNIYYGTLSPKHSKPDILSTFPKPMCPPPLLDYTSQSLPASHLTKISPPTLIPPIKLAPQQKFQTKNKQANTTTNAFQNNTTGQKSWASLIKSSTPRLPLHFVKPQSIPNTNVLKLPIGTSKAGEEKWKSTLVGYFLDRKFPLGVVINRANTLWANFGLEKVILAGEGLYFFIFRNCKDSEKVLGLGPWFIAGHSLFLKRWSREADLAKEEFCSVPVWTKLHNIPSVYYTDSGLSCIASRIGIPLFTDEITSSANKLEYARVCIDIKAGSEFPRSFWVESEHGEKFEVRVEYSWMPKQCIVCNVFGHHTSMCTKKPKQVYRPKPIIIESEEINSRPKTTSGSTSKTTIAVMEGATGPCSHVEFKEPTECLDRNKSEPLAIITSNKFHVLMDENGEHDSEDLHESPKLVIDLSSFNPCTPLTASPDKSLLAKKVLLVDEIDKKKKKNRRRSGEKNKKGENGSNLRGYKSLSLSK